ncbi:MAG: penicillin-binding transpeptidase domain-containing protein, partial [Acutalibacteraceae bacterium]|nr:penicillin-binding transpeptidase domain-containing protein [Acutalibacteraceae bacterium]
SYGSATNFVTVQSALAQSLNTVPAQLLNRMSISSSVEFLHDDLKLKYTVDDEDDPKYDGNLSSLACGGMTNGTTTLEMTAAYAIFGNNGYYFEPYCYYKVTNNDGTETLLKSGNSEGKQVISESTAGVMRQLLRTVVNGGTGGGYGVSGFDTFAKTGTTSDDKDRWFVGGTPYYVAAVWYGYDEPREITNTSGNPAGKIFKAIMNDVHEDLESMSYPTASGVVARSYCKISGDIASPGCAETGTGYYKSSHIPSKCKNCAMIHAIGSEIPDEVTGASATEETTKKKKKDKNKKTTKPATTIKTTVAPTTTKPVTTIVTQAPTETEAVATTPETSEEVVAVN